MLPAQVALDMATRNGATALGLAEIGRLQPGARADMTALDLASPNLMPLHDPVSQAVYAATGGEVRLTMVNGRVLYMDGQHLALDLPDLLAEAREIVGWAKEQRETC